MNRLFTTALAVSTAALALFFAALVAAAAAEMNRSAAVRPPEWGEILFAVRLSLATAAAASAAAVLAAIPVAYLLSRSDFRGKALLDTLLDLPVALSPIAVGALLLAFFRTPAGARLEALLGPFVLDVRGIVLAQFVVVVGLAVRMMKTAFDGVDPEYEDLARSLGATRAGAFLHVSLPLARRAVAATFLLVFARALGEFGATVTLAGAMPHRTSTVPVAIHLAYGTADVSSMMALILVAVGFSLGLLLLLRLFEPGRGR